jgi:hypothetical protein
LTFSTVDNPGGLKSQTHDESLVLETLADGSGFQRYVRLGKVLASTSLYADAAKQYTNIRVPTLILQGVEDNIIDARLVAYYVRRFHELRSPKTEPWFEAIFFNGRGHLLISENRPIEVSKDVLTKSMPKEANPVHQAIDIFLSDARDDSPWLKILARDLTADQAERAQRVKSLARCAL